MLQRGVFVLDIRIRGVQLAQRHLHRRSVRRVLLLYGHEARR